ncbi:MAG: MarR family winged helix-turn-helix transcriptional regulator [Desulfobacterales bacterium]
MHFSDVTEQAQYIFSTGTFIRDRLLQIQNDHLAARGSDSIFTNLSLKQIQVVLMVGKQEPLSVKELAGLLAVSPPSASAMADRLVERGVLVREHCAEDRRRVVIRVSPEARSEMEEMKEVLIRAFVDVVERIGPDLADQWCEVLSVVKSALEED